MSSVYTTEPATAGRVIFETSDGPLEIYLWCRECPMTTRYFLQLCLDGFYNDMVFHRIVGNFLIQTGALRHEESTSASKTVSLSSPEAAAYRQAVRAQETMDRRPYEVNSRIKYNHRGQVGMSLGVNDKGDFDLQPQFFITLEDAPYLDGNNLIFGTISGPTIFNALRIGRTETDETTHQPVDLPNATRILSVKIVDNPIHTDLVPQPTVPWRSAVDKQNSTTKGQETANKKKKKRKGKFDTNVLSFGSELVDEEEGGGSGIQVSKSKVRKGMQSSHDVVESKVLSKKVDDKVKDRVLNDDDDDLESSKPTDQKKNDKTTTKKSRIVEEMDDDEKEDAAPSISVNDEVAEPPVKFSSKKDRKQPKADDANEQDGNKKDNKDKEASSSEAKPTKPKVSLVEARRMKYSKGKKSKREREEETLSRLMSFRSTVQQKVEERKSTSTSHSGDGGSDGNALAANDNSLASRMARKALKESGADKQDSPADQAPTYHGQVLDSDEDDNQNGGRDSKSQRAWLGTAFKCRRHMDHDSHLGGDGRDADDYEVIDAKRGDGKGKHKSRSHHREDKKKHSKKRHDKL